MFFILFLRTVQKSTFLFKNISYAIGILCTNGVNGGSVFCHAFVKLPLGMITQPQINCNAFPQFHAFIDFIHDFIRINVQCCSGIRMARQFPDYIRILRVRSGSAVTGYRKEAHMSIDHRIQFDFLTFSDQIHSAYCKAC